MTQLMKTLAAVGALVTTASGCGILTAGGGPEKTSTPTKRPSPTASAKPVSRLSLPENLTDDAVCGLVSKTVLKSVLGRPSEQPTDDVETSLRSASADCEWRNTTSEGEGAGEQRNLTVTVRRFKAGPDETGKNFTAVQWAKGGYAQEFQTARENQGDKKKSASTTTTYGKMLAFRGTGDQNFFIYDRYASSLQRNGGVNVYIQVGDATVTISYRGYGQAPGGPKYDGSGNKPMSEKAATAGAWKVTKDIMKHVVKG